MYYEDLLETVVNEPVEKKTMPTLARKIDDNYEKHKISVNKTWKDGRFYKDAVIELYGSSQTGSRIRNAVTGQRYPHLVGSSDEDLYFKVSDSTGREGRSYPLTLFYDSPEQYENHFFTTLEPHIKSLWQDKNFAARQRYSFD